MNNEEIREQFEQAVIARMKESGFLEVEVRVECLRRDGGDNGDGYYDSSVDAWWHFWQESRAQLVVELPEGEWMGAVDPEFGLNDGKVRAAIESTGAKVKA